MPLQIFQNYILLYEESNALPVPDVQSQIQNPSFKLSSFLIHKLVSALLVVFPTLFPSLFLLVIAVVSLLLLP